MKTKPENYRKAKLLLMLISTFSVLVVVEIYLRFFSYQSINRTWDCYQPDLKMYVTYKPLSSCEYRRYNEFDLTTRINNVGLRSDSMTTFEKPTGVKRILVLGDSYVAAHEVEERQTFVKQIENMLRSNGLFIEVLNGGIRGYSPFLDRFYLEYHGSKFDPDIVIHVVNTGDFSEDQRFQLYQKKDTKTGNAISVYPNWSFYQERAISTESAKQVSKSKQNILITITNYFSRFETAKILRSGVDKVMNYFVGVDAITQSFVAADFRTDPFTIDREMISNSEHDLMLADTKNNIQKISDLVASRGKKYILVIQPAGHEVSKTEWRIGRQTLGFSANKIYPPKALNEIALWAKQNEITVIDLIPVLSEEHTENYYLPIDGHLSIQGHTKVAETLSGEIMRYLKLN